MELSDGKKRYKDIMKLQKLYQVLVVLLLSACGQIEIIIPSETPQPPAALPDLVISSVSLEMQGRQGNCVPAYAPFEIHVSVTNQGESPAMNISVVETSTGTEIMIRALEPGQSTLIVFPAASGNGIYWIGVDALNDILESDDGNNSFSYVAPTPTPPLICTPVVQSTQAPQDFSGGVPLDVLRNGIYRSPDWGEFQLTDGVFYRTPQAPQDSAGIYTTRIHEPVYYGDVNMDGFQDALVILNTQNGGTGHFIELALVLDQNGTAFNVSTVSLGDRVVVEGAAVDNGVIILNMKVQGPNDGMCCPSQLVIWSFILTGDRLVKLP